MTTESPTRDGQLAAQISNTVVRALSRTTGRGPTKAKTTLGPNIESSFAAVKLRTKVTKGAGSKKAALAMAYKLLNAAQQRWRRFDGHELVSDVLDGAKFKDGIKVTDDETTTNERVAA